MKCIKNKCKFCHDNWFWSSYVECNLDGCSFLRDSNRECTIPSKINELQRQIENLEKYGKFVEFKGK